MSERDLTVSNSDRSGDDWEQGSTTRAPGADPGGGGVSSWLGARLETAVARLTSRFSRRPKGDDGEDSTALVRTGGALARWISFPRGVRLATAATSSAAAGLAAWGMVAVAGNDLGIAAAAAGAAAALSTAWGPIAVRLANRLHRLVVKRRLVRIADLRDIPDRRSVAVRGIVIARRTSASALDGRAAVWSLTRFRGGGWPARSFFHESAYDFLLDDGTDEPVWVEVAGGMLIERFPPEERVQFHSTTLLELEHPFLTRLRIDSRPVRGAEIQFFPGAAMGVVGGLSRRLDPRVGSQRGGDPPQRRVLRSGTRVPVLIKKVSASDAALARVRRIAPPGTPALSPGEPPL